MGSVASRSVSLSTGETLTVRPAAPGDAGAVVDLFRDVDETTDFLVTEPDERDLDPGSRRRWIERHLEADGSLLLLALAGDFPVGELDLDSLSSRRRVAHVARLGMVVREGWRGHGVGAALLESALDWARAHPTIEKVALGVFATNTHAIALYRRYGFAEEGRDVREYRLGPRRYADGLRMATFVKP
jgi:GNAT superfamily N-acetyltransferase